MNLQLWQLENLLLYATLILVVIYAPKWAKVAAIVLMFVIFAVNPLRYAQEGITVQERSVNRFTEIPKKIIVEEMDYEQFSNSELNKLKQQSGELENEIHN